jgi:hypothetical protein
MMIHDRPALAAPHRGISVARRVAGALVCAWLVIGGMAQAGDEPAQPVAAYANRQSRAASDPQTARATQAYRVMLGKLPVTRMAEERAAAEPAKGVPPKIGFPRAVATLQDAAALATQTGWETLPDGGHVMAVSIASPEAAGLRIGLLVQSLPREATLRVYAQDDRSVVDSIDGGEILDTLARNRASGDASDAARTYWTPLVAGAEATLEIELPPGIATDTLRVAIPRVSHLLLTPRQYDSERTTRRAAACNLDISCSPYLGEWIDYSKSVALMDFVDGGATYVCTGTLLADSGNSFTPYFLSANHCIDSQTIASTLNTTWFYRSATCNGYGVFPGWKEVAGGATLLYHSATTDTSFMRLTRAAPDGAIYAGWLPALPTRYAAAVGIHHPTGDFQKISFGYIGEYTTCSTDASAAVYCESASAANATFLDVTWQQGITESGSSGSPLWVQYNDGNYYLVGALYAGSSSCYADGTDSYGRFDLAYDAALKQWLSAGAAAEHSLTVNKTGAGTVASSPGGIACGSDCLEVYAAGTSVTLTATPAGDYNFLRWGGACSGTATTCNLTLSEARGVDAYFVRPLSKGTPLTQLSGTLNSEALFALAVPAGAADLTIVTSGSSGDVDMFVRRDEVPSGDTYDCVSQGPDANERCVVAAPAPGSYYILLKGFTAYSGATLSATYTTMLSAYTLTISLDGTGRVTSSPAGIDCGSDCSESYIGGTSVTLTATPGPGSSFTGWDGACSGSATNCTLAMTGAANVGASFVDTTQLTASNCLFDWAERNYPDWFVPAGTTSQSLAGYYLRHYATSQAYLATLDGQVYYLGPLSDNRILGLGALADWLITAGCN